MIDVKTAKRVDLLSMKKLLGAIAPPKIGETKWLCVVYGFCSSFSSKTDERGLKVTFGGDFLAHSLQPIGETEPSIAVMRSNLLSLPVFAAEKLMACGIGGGTVCEFGFRIGVQGEDSLAGFSYLAHSFIGLHATTPLDDLLARMPADHWRENGEALADLEEK